LRCNEAAWKQEGLMADRAGPVLVIGATGHQGGAAARALLERGWAVRALVRDENKPAARQLREAGADLIAGDLDDPGSIRAAMSSVSGVFLALTMMTGPRVTLEGVAADLAGLAAGGKLEARTSGQRAARRLGRMT
jgi:uncharacterized protein YbjT (DUF2867 family)